MIAVARRAVLLSGLLLVAASARAETPYITVASTTSTEQSGLFGHLLPAFTKSSGIEVRVVAVGTGQALKIGERGDCDVLFVHDKPSELKFVADGFGIGRREVMYNDFVLVGPSGDPAKVDGGHDVVAALRKIAAAKAPFVSRGDDSGTDKAEKRLWQEAGTDIKAASGTWYRDTGSGMGPTLNTAAAMDGYTLADRGTWLSFQNRRALKIVVEGDRRLFNQYGVMLVNPARHASVKQELGRRFIDWLVSPAGQATIAAYQINGQQLVLPQRRARGLTIGTQRSARRNGDDSGHARDDFFPAAVERGRLGRARAVVPAQRLLLGGDAVAARMGYRQVIAGIVRAHQHLAAGAALQHGQHVTRQRRRLRLRRRGGWRRRRAGRGADERQRQHGARDGAVHRQASGAYCGGKPGGGGGGGA